MKHKDTPAIVKIVAAITICYALSPIDLIPDFIPVLGYIDDLVLLPALVALTVKLIPRNIWESCKLEAENLWSDGKPKKWYYAIPIIVVWLIIIFFLIKIIWR